MIIAEEQFAGMGRNSRSWSSPAGKGIYATTLLTRPTAELPLVPLTVANIVATYLRDVFSIDARIKWPNDILVDGRKIAGILIEARIQDDRTFLVIGVGINVDPIRDEARPNAIAIREVSKRAFGGIAIMMYTRNTLKLFLDPKFHPFILWAGVALLVMVVVRAVAVERR